jgi:Ca2+-binding RTX toxin-like protein
MAERKGKQMNTKALRTALLGIACAAWLAVPMIAATSASASTGRHVVHCKPGSTVQHPCRGTRGADKIIGTAGNDVIDAGAGNDVVMGEGGDDTINGGSGNDHLDGGDGNDTLNGGRGSDDLTGDNGDDVEHGGSGHDQLDCGDGTDSSDDSSGDTATNCEQTIQTYDGTVTSFDGSTISVQYTSNNDAAQTFLDANGDPNPVTANVTPDTEIEGGTPTVGEVVELQAVTNSTDATQLDALKIDKQDDGSDG